MALSRVRHPDDLMLEDDLPTMAVIQRQKRTLGYARRQQWERRQRVKFSRTLRRHMRDPEIYSSERVWTADESSIADALLKEVTSNKTSTDDEVLHRCQESLAQSTPSEAVHAVWRRMRLFPHVFEVAHARGDVDSLDLHGRPLSRQAAAVEKVQVLIDQNQWNVPMAELYDFGTEGSLSTGVWQMLANRFQAFLDDTIVLSSPYALKGKDAIAPTKLLAVPRRKQQRPRVRIFPCCSQSHRWAVFFVQDDLAASAPSYRLTAIVPQRTPVGSIRLDSYTTDQRFPRQARDDTRSGNIGQL